MKRYSIEQLKKMLNYVEKILIKNREDIPNILKYNLQITTAKNNLDGTSEFVLRKGKKVYVENDSTVITQNMIIFKILERVEKELNNIIPEKIIDQTISDLLSDLELATNIRKDFYPLTKNKNEEILEKLKKKYLQNEDILKILVSTGKDIYQHLEKVIAYFLSVYLRHNLDFISIITLFGDIIKFFKDAFSSNKEEEFTIKDLKKALTSLKNSGEIHSLIIENETIFIELVPFDRSNDKNLIIELAKKHNGKLDYVTITNELNWSDLRINRAMDYLCKENIAILDNSYSNGCKWYFPQIYK